MGLERKDWAEPASGAAAGAGGHYCSDQYKSRKDGEAKSNPQKITKNWLHYHISDDLKPKVEKDMKNVEIYHDDMMDTIRFMLGDIGGRIVFYDILSMMLRLKLLFILVDPSKFL